MSRVPNSLQALAASVAFATFVVFVFDFFFLSDFTAWGRYQCAGRLDEMCAVATHLGKWRLLYDFLAVILLSVSTWAIARLALSILAPRPKLVTKDPDGGRS